MRHVLHSWLVSTDAPCLSVVVVFVMTCTAAEQDRAYIWRRQQQGDDNLPCHEEGHNDAEGRPDQEVSAREPARRYSLSPYVAQKRHEHVGRHVRRVHRVP